MFVEGPYGKLTGARRTRRSVTLIAGGIGITPLRALLESLPGEPGDLTLIYRATTADQLVFRTELDTLAAHRGAQVHYLVGSRRAGEPGRPMAGPSLDAATLARLVPDDRRAGRLPVRADGADGLGPRRARRARGARAGTCTWSSSPTERRLASMPRALTTLSAASASLGDSPINPTADPRRPVHAETRRHRPRTDHPRPRPAAELPDAGHDPDAGGLGAVGISSDERSSVAGAAPTPSAAGGTASGRLDRPADHRGLDSAATASEPRGRRRRRAPRSTRGMAPSRSR